MVFILISFCFIAEYLRYTIDNIIVDSEDYLTDLKTEDFMLLIEVKSYLPLVRLIIRLIISPEEIHVNGTIIQQTEYRQQQLLRAGNSIDIDCSALPDNCTIEIGKKYQISGSYVSPVFYACSINEVVISIDI